MADRSLISRLRVVLRWDLDLQLFGVFGWHLDLFCRLTLALVFTRWLGGRQSILLGHLISEGRGLSFALRLGRAFHRSFCFGNTFVFGWRICILLSTVL